MSQSSKALLIEVYSDVICPWCYVGKRRLERALDQLHGDPPVDVKWRPFQLNPTMPKEGMERKVYIEAKFGRLENFKAMEQRLIEAGSPERIPFAFEKIARTPNTFQAHRLIWYAGLQGRQDAVVDQLFIGYFEEGLDIGSRSVLVALADRAGLKADRFLASDEGTVEVKAEESVGRRLGLRGVPYFVIDKTDDISGAQPAEVFVSAIKKFRSSMSTMT